MHQHKTARTHEHAAAKRAAIASFLTFALYIILVNSAYAEETNTPMGDVLCDVVNFVVYGNLGRGLATLAIIIVGVGATLGKVSWGLAITVGVGISVIFGAYDIGTKLGVGGVCTPP